MNVRTGLPSLGNSNSDERERQSLSDIEVQQ